MKLFLFMIIFLFHSCSGIIINRSELPIDSMEELKTQLKEFTSDGCSMWPDGTRSRPKAWFKCCYTHDRIYWLGGTQEERKTADQDLKSCVKESFSNFMSILMYMGVRIGGGPIYNTSYRWGYGWNYDRGYVSVSREEYEFAQKLSPFLLL